MVMSPIPRVRGWRRRGGAAGVVAWRRGARIRCSMRRDSIGEQSKLVRDERKRMRKRQTDSENGNQNGLIAGFYPAYHFYIIENIPLFIIVYPFITPLWARCNKLQQDFAASTPPRLMTT